MPQRISLKDVARRAGVSVPTASRVVSGVERNVDPELAWRVRQACDELGYRVNGAARALRRQATEALALVVPGIANDYFAELVAACSRQLSGRGRRLVAMDTDEDVVSERRQLSEMDRVLVDGVLIAPVSAAHSGQAIIALAATHRVVQIDRIADGVAAPSVRMDNAAGMELLIRHLRDQGRRNILLVDAQQPSSASIERVAAFRALSGPTDWVLEMPNFSVRSGTDAAARMMDDPRGVDAVICTADVVAVGMLTRLQHAGLAVPEDIALASFDGTHLVDIAAPGLTSLRSPVEQLVRAAVTLIDDAEPTDIVIAPELITRGSTMRL